MSAFVSVEVTQLDSNNFNINVNSQKNEFATESEKRIANSINVAITEIAKVSREILDSMKEANDETH